MYHKVNAFNSILSNSFDCIHKCKIDLLNKRIHYRIRLCEIAPVTIMYDK